MIVSANDLFGRFQIVERIHTGVVGELYKAYDPDRDEIVALKMLKGELSYEPEVVERFEREAKVAKNLDHPNIIKIYDIGCDDNCHYFSMKFINGPSLRKILEEEGSLSIEKAFTFARGVCLGLHFAHSAQVVHRDIKPSNIMLDENGNIIILDFGIAKVMYLARLTRPGFLLGTPEYMSPEQIKGSLIDGRSDLYSLGIVLYELLTGTVPFIGKDFWEAAEKVVKEIPRKPSEFNRELSIEIDELILKAIDKDRTRRFSTGLEMANAINRILGLPPEEIEETPKPILAMEGKGGKEERRAIVTIPRESRIKLSKTFGEKKGFWLPPAIALGILLILYISSKSPFLVPLFLILGGAVALIGVLNIIKIKKLPKRYSSARLLLFDGVEFSREFLLNATSVVIGRDQSEGVELFKETISRSHAQIINENGFYVIYDLNSTNGTFVNNRRIQRYLLKDGDRVNIGGETLVFHGIE